MKANLKVFELRGSTYGKKPQDKWRSPLSRDWKHTVAAPSLDKAIEKVHTYEIDAGFYVDDGSYHNSKTDFFAAETISVLEAKTICDLDIPWVQF